MKLFNRVVGSGPPLVILHGLYGSSDNWMSIARMLKDKFTVILPDLRNHGRSPHSDEMGYSLMADDIRDILGERGVKKVFMVGHSMGGKVATCFALRYPDQLMGLVVADISPFITEGKAEEISAYHKSIIRCLKGFDAQKADSRSAVEKYLIDCVGNRNIGIFLAKNAVREGTYFRLKLNVEAISSNFKYIFAPVTESFETTPLPVTGFPVIFLRGVLSPYLPPDSMSQITKFFPAAEMHSIEDAGHWLHSEKPEEVCAVITSLLD